MLRCFWNLFIYDGKSIYLDSFHTRCMDKYNNIAYSCLKQVKCYLVPAYKLSPQQVKCCLLLAHFQSYPNKPSLPLKRLPLFSFLSLPSVTTNQCLVCSLNTFKKQTHNSSKSLLSKRQNNKQVEKILLK